MLVNTFLFCFSRNSIQGIINRSYYRMESIIDLARRREFYFPFVNPNNNSSEFNSSDWLEEVLIEVLWGGKDNFGGKVKRRKSF